MNAPRYAVFVMVDEPEGIKETYGYATGGWVAAPAVAAVHRSEQPTQWAVVAPSVIACCQAS